MCLSLKLPPKTLQKIKYVSFYANARGKAFLLRPEVISGEHKDATTR